MNITSKLLLAAALLFAVSATAQTHVKPLERDIEIPIVDNRRSPIPKYLQMKPVALLGQQLGLSDAQLDAMFVTAAGGKL